ncbi:MAG: Mu-like prophage major head subunit gpT family protein [Pirellulales bacterium]
MATTTAAYQVVQRDLTQQFNMRAGAATPFYPEICTIVPSTSIDEKYGWLGALPGVREWLGDRLFKQLRAANYTLANKDWESSLEFEKNDIDDYRTGGFLAQIQGLADEATYHPDELLFQVIANAEATACFDGQYFFDTDHSWGDSGTQSNDLTYAATTGTAPTTAEWKASFHQALIAMLGFKNDQGKYYIRPRVGKLGNLIACVPLAQYEVANAAFEQVISVEGSVATTNVYLEKPKVIPCQYITDAAKWHLYYVGGPVRPFVFQARRPLSFQMKGADDIEYKYLKAMTWARYNIGFGHWASAVLTTFT